MSIHSQGMKGRGKAGKRYKTRTPVFSPTEALRFLKSRRTKKMKKAKMVKRRKMGTN